MRSVGALGIALGSPFIAALLKNGLVFQAFHQHLPMDRQIWFVHFRGRRPIRRRRSTPSGSGASCTATHPQRYFDHMAKVGDAYELAREIRRGLDLTDAQ